MCIRDSNTIGVFSSELPAGLTFKISLRILFTESFELANIFTPPRSFTSTNATYTSSCFDNLSQNNFVFIGPITMLLSYGTTVPLISSISEDSKPVNL